jgi:hypothetical protein
MGLIKVSEALHEELREICPHFQRSINAQAEYWIRIGLLAEMNPTLCYQDLLKRMLSCPDTELKTLLHHVQA